MTGGPWKSERPRRAGVAVLLVTLGCLSSCSDDPPTPPTTTTAAPASSTTAAPSPTPTPPTAPTATKPTPESAEAFVRYFWDVYNYSYQSLDTASLEKISTDGCKFCKSTLQEITDLRTQRKQLTGGTIRPGTVAAPPGKISGGVIVTQGSGVFRDCLL